jgi:hypothetical protein
MSEILTPDKARSKLVQKVMLYQNIDAAGKIQTSQKPEPQNPDGG